MDFGKNGPLYGLLSPYKGSHKNSSIYWVYDLYKGFIKLYQKVVGFADVCGPYVLLITVDLLAHGPGKFKALSVSYFIRLTILAQI